MKPTIKVIAEVYLAGLPCGHILFDESVNRWGFQYVSQFLKSSPLSLSWSLPRGGEAIWYSGDGPLPYFSHLLPEGWLREVVRQLKIDVSNPRKAIVELCRDTIGAVEIYPPGAPYTARSADHTTELPTIESGEVPGHAYCLYCHQVLLFRGENRNYHKKCSLALFGDETPPILRLRGEDILPLALGQLGGHHSLPGVQMKFSATIRERRTTMMMPRRFIVKPEPHEEYFRDVARMETASMHFAQALGISVASSGLIYLADSTPAFITRRFDRQDDGTKVHAEDLAQARSIVDKYDGSIEDLADFLRHGALANLSEDLRCHDLTSFLHVTLFNYLIGNSDNHLKNYTLLHTVDEIGSAVIRLAPFYDLMPARIFALSDKDEIGLSLEGRKEDYTIRDFRALARRMGLGEKNVDSFVSGFKKKAQFFRTANAIMKASSDHIEASAGYVAARLSDLERIRPRGSLLAPKPPVKDAVGFRQEIPGTAANHVNTPTSALLTANRSTPAQAPMTVEAPALCESCKQNPKERGRRRYCAPCGALSDLGKLER